MITNDLGQVVGENLLPPTHSPLGGKWDRYTTDRTTRLSNIKHDTLHLGHSVPDFGPRTTEVGKILYNKIAADCCLQTQQNVALIKSNQNSRQNLDNGSLLLPNILGIVLCHPTHSVK